MVDLHDVIDSENNVIGTVLRKNKTPDMMLRFVHIYIFDDQNNMVIQQRTENVTWPNLLNPSAAGHVDAGEDFDVAAHRELKEELGIETDLEFICDSWSDYGLCKIYKGVYNGILTPEEREVKTLDKISFYEVVRLYRCYPYLFINGFQHSLKCYLDTVYSLFDEVDENDNIIGQCNYDDMCAKRLSVRVIHVLIRNKKGELLFQQRSKNIADPMVLDDAATGHVDTGETYEEAAEREAFEEIGVKINLSNVKPFLYEKLPNNKFCKAYIVEHEGPFITEENEVANLVWLTLAEVKMMMHKTPFLFTQSALTIHKKYKEFKEKQEIS